MAVKQQKGVKYDYKRNDLGGNMAGDKDWGGPTTCSNCLFERAWKPNVDCLGRVA